MTDPTTIVSTPAVATAIAAGAGFLVREIVTVAKNLGGKLAAKVAGSNSSIEKTILAVITGPVKDAIKAEIIADLKADGYIVTKAPGAPAPAAGQ